MSGEYQHWWCDRCDKASYSTGICGTCKRDDAMYELNERTAKERMQALAAQREDTRHEVEMMLRMERCDDCGGRKDRRSDVEKYRASALPRPVGKGNLTGQPGNMTGGRVVSVVTVRPCKCAPKEQPVTKERVEVEEVTMVPGERSGERKRPDPLRAAELLAPMVTTEAKTSHPAAWLVERQLKSLVWDMRRKGMRV